MNSPNWDASSNEVVDYLRNALLVRSGSPKELLTQSNNTDVADKLVGDSIQIP